MTPVENPLVEGYMNQLRAALADLPEPRREEIAEAVAQHIADAWVELDDESEAAVRTMLEHLGEPEVIAADALEGEWTEPPESPRSHSDRTRIKRLVIAGVIVVFVVMGGLFAFVITPRPSTPSSSGIPIKHAQRPTLLVAVPNVVGLTGYRATAALQAAGLRVVLRSAPATAGNPPGLVARQTPPAGVEVAAGATVEMAVPAAVSSSTTTTIIAPTTTTITAH